MSDLDHAAPPSGPIVDVTALAQLRTRAALDRTLLAWIRTAFALQGFGFTLATYVSQWIRSGAVHGVPEETPRRLGLTLLAAGMLGLVGGTIEHRRAARRLGDATGEPSWSVAVPIALMMIAVSALMFVGAVLKTGPYAQ